MPNDKLRRQIAFEAARMAAAGHSGHLGQTKLAAARRVCRGWVHRNDLPSDADIRHEILSRGRLFDGDPGADNLQLLRLGTLRMLLRLNAYQPRVRGGVVTGELRHGSSVSMTIVADDLRPILTMLDAARIPSQVAGSAAAGSRHLVIHEEVDFDVEVFGEGMPQASIVTPDALDLHELRMLLARDYPDLDLETVESHGSQDRDRFEVYRSLLLPLETVQQGHDHPEGDALYHSLQVFTLVREECPFDEELQLAALLHDVGKAFDPLRSVAAGLSALDGHITDRTAWLIERHHDARKLLNGTLGARGRRRLTQSDEQDALLLLARSNRDGRVCGANVPALDEALDSIRELAQLCG